MRRKFLYVIMLCFICFFKVEAKELQDEEKEIPAKVYFEKGKLNFKSLNENFHLGLDNRIYVDYSYYFPTVSIDDLT